MLTFATTKKQDLETLAKLYKKAFNAMWDKWTDKTALHILEYRYSKKIKLTVKLDNKIIWACFADIKPLYFGNIISDWDVFIDPKYQNKWYGKEFFLYITQFAKKKYNVIGRDFFTFKIWFQRKRYEKIWFNINEKRCMMTGNIDEIIRNLKK